MTYEKKVEPLTKTDVLGMGITLQLWLIFSNILPWVHVSNDCIEAVFEADTSNSNDLSDVHNCIKGHRFDILAGATHLLLGFPFVIAHIYYLNRVCTIYLRWLHMGLTLNTIYASWFISSCILCVIMPALMIFVCYYDWEFASGYESIGYFMQYQFLHLSLILYDCTIIPLGLAMISIYIPPIYAANRLSLSSHYKSIKTNDELYNDILSYMMLAPKKNTKRITKKSINCIVYLCNYYITYFYIWWYISLCKRWIF